MIDIPKLLIEIRRQGKTQRGLAQELNMNQATFYRKIKKGVFDSDEISDMIKILNISNPCDIFFASRGT